MTGADTWFLHQGNDDPWSPRVFCFPWAKEFTWPPERHWVDGGHFYFEQRPFLATGLLASLIRADQHFEVI